MSTSTSTVLGDFQVFWAAYPRRDAKKDARKAWDQIRPTPALLQEILTALAWQTQKPQWTKDQGQYIPLPASWLRGERWTDEAPAALRGSVPSQCPRCGSLEGLCADIKVCNRRWLDQQKKSPPVAAETA